MTTIRDYHSRLDHHLGLRAGAAAVGAVGVARELDHLVGGQLENGLEPTSNRHQDLLALLARPALATGDVTVAAAGDGATRGSGPNTDTVERLTDVDNDAHHLTVLLVLQRLADSAQHGVQPELVNVDRPLLLELERPLATVLVLRILPLWPHTLLEKMVVRLEGKLGHSGDVVLFAALDRHRTGKRRYCEISYVDTPEFFHRLEGNDLLQQVVPVVALRAGLVRMMYHGGVVELKGEPFR